MGLQLLTDERALEDAWHRAEEQGDTAEADRLFRMMARYSGFDQSLGRVELDPIDLQ
jgi:hypothetical protein